MNAILKYPGGKWRIAEWIINHFPPHKVYCEPYFGSGAVFFTKPPTPIETINDVDGNVVNLFEICRDYPEELARLIEYTPWSREEFEKCEDLEIADHIERARRTVVRYHQSFGASNSSKRSWRNVQSSGGPRCATMWNYLPEAIQKTCGRLKEAQIENVDAIELIRRYDDPNTLLYLDPPYPQEIRKRSMYKHEMTSEQHDELLEAILKSKSKIMISSYGNAKYDEALKNWETSELKTTAQMGLSRTEKIYMNYQPPLLALAGIEKIKKEGEGHGKE